MLRCFLEISDYNIPAGQQIYVPLIADRPELPESRLENALKTA